MASDSVFNSRVGSPGQPIRRRHCRGRKRFTRAPIKLDIGPIFWYFKSFPGKNTADLLVVHTPIFGGRTFVTPTHDHLHQHILDPPLIRYTRPCKNNSVWQTFGQSATRLSGLYRQLAPNDDCTGDCKVSGDEYSCYILRES